MNIFNWISNKEIFQQLNRIEKKMSQNQEIVNQLVSQLAKAKQEILAQISALQEQINAGQTIDLSALALAVQSLDDLNPDEPEPEPSE